MSHDNTEFPKVDRPKDFGVIRNHGSIMQWKNDIYGNQYALYKINAKLTGLGGIGADGFNGGDGDGFASAIGGLLGLDESDTSQNTNDVDRNDTDLDDEVAIGFFDDDGCYVPGDANNCLIVDGHVFNDPVDGGLNFDYSKVDNDYQNLYWELRGLDDQITTMRTGLTSRTVQTLTDFLSVFNTDNGLSAARVAETNAVKTGTLGGDPYLFFPCSQTIAKPNGLPCIDINFIPFQFCLDLFAQNQQVCIVKDAQTFTKAGGASAEPLTEFVSSESDIWPGGGSYYYTFLYEAGLGASETRPNSANPAEFTFEKALTASDLKFGEADTFSLVCIDDSQENFGDSSNVTDGSGGNNQTGASGLTGDGALGFGRTPVNSVFANKTEAGVLFFRNAKTTEVSFASAALSNIFEKYPAEVKTELDTLIVNIEVVYDVIFIQTKNYFVYDKIIYDTETGEILKPLSQRNFFKHTNPSKDFHRISNTFFLESEERVYFAEVEILPELSATNHKIIYPTIKSVDLATVSTKQEYPNTSLTFDNLQEFSLVGLQSVLDINIVSIETPVLTYNSRNQIFNLSYIGKDLNNIPYIITNEFKFENSVMVLKSANFFKTDLHTSSVNYNSGGSTAGKVFYGENTGTSGNTAFTPTIVLSSGCLVLK